MTAIQLGLPEVPVLRRKSRAMKVGSVPVGGGAPVSVQSMTTTPTSDVEATLRQIAELTAAGCQIVRVAVPSQDDADALPAIASKSGIPVVADIHFQPRYVFAAIDAGCAAVRVNPGNIKKFDDKIAEIARAALAAGVPIRIGVNAGSLDQRQLVPCVRSSLALAAPRHAPRGSGETATMENIEAAPPPPRCTHLDTAITQTTSDAGH